MLRQSFGVLSANSNTETRYFYINFLLGLRKRRENHFLRSHDFSWEQTIQVVNPTVPNCILKLRHDVSVYTRSPNTRRIPNIIYSALYYGSIVLIVSNQWINRTSRRPSSALKVSTILVIISSPREYRLKVPNELTGNAGEFASVCRFNLALRDFQVDMTSSLLFESSVSTWVVCSSSSRSPSIIGQPIPCQCASSKLEPLGRQKFESMRFLLFVASDPKLGLLLKSLSLSVSSESKASRMAVVAIWKKELRYWLSWPGIPQPPIMQPPNCA